MELNDKFLYLYNKLDTVLKDRYHITSYSVSAIKTYEDELKRSTFESIRDRGFCLETIRNVRNTLIHDAKLYAEDAFNIKQEVIDFLERELDLLTKIKTAKDIAIPSDKIIFACLNSNIKDLITEMKIHCISHAPIIKANRLIGVFSESTFYTYCLKNDSINNINELKVSDFIDYIALDKHSSESFVFAKRNENLDTISSLFKRDESKKRIAMIFITKNGLASEEIEGIITPSLLLKCE